MRLCVVNSVSLEEQIVHDTLEAERDGVVQSLALVARQVRDRSRGVGREQIVKGNRLADNDSNGLANRRDD